VIRPPLILEKLVKPRFFLYLADERKYLQDKIRHYCHYTRRDFPGSQPVSLEGPRSSNNLEFLTQGPYMVSWKADGVRYLILIEGLNKVYAFDRDNNVFRIPNLVFPKSQPDVKLVGDEHLHDTLVDAELVIDHVKGPEGRIEDTARLLIYDIISFMGMDVGKKEPFNRRFRMIDKELIQPRIQAFTTGRFQRKNELMGVRRKDFYNIAYTHKLFAKNFLGDCAHEVDGLVFQPDLKPYTAGRFDYLLKWKPPDQSSIDFKLLITKVSQAGCLPIWVGNLYVLGLEVPFSSISPVTKTLKQYDKKIIECRYNMEKKCWEFMRERTDKSHPNAFATAKSVLQTIQFPIVKDELLRFIHERGFGVREELAQRAMASKPRVTKVEPETTT